MALTKNQIVEAVQEGLYPALSQKQAIEAVNTLIEIIKQTLSNFPPFLF